MDDLRASAPGPHLGRDFRFGGCVLIGSSLYIVQRTSRQTLFETEIGFLRFLGYQAFIVLAALGYVTGVTQSKEYAEPDGMSIFFSPLSGLFTP